MCGILGYQPITPSDDVCAAFTRLFDESRVRGTHAYGLATPTEVTKSFQWEYVVREFDPREPTIAHCRYCQSGDWQTMANNQPLVVADMAVAMNGVLHMGTKEEFEAAFGVRCRADNDSEIFLRVLESAPNRYAAAQQFLAGLTGSCAAVWLDQGVLFAGRNARRPLWRCSAYGALWYASTADIFARAGFPLATEVPVGVEHA